MYSANVSIAIVFATEKSFQGWLRRVQKTMGNAKDWTLKITDITVEKPRRKARRGAK